MSVSLKDLVSYCSGLLNAQKIKDYCPNGLQVEGASEIQKISWWRHRVSSTNR